MKLPSFNYLKRKWDQYSEFHIGVHNHFVQFETGELLVVREPRWVHDRKFYENVGVHLFHVGDEKGCEFLRGKKFRDPETGEVVKKSWLPQHKPMLYDPDTNRVVALVRAHNRKYTKRKLEAIPKRFVEAYHLCYFPGEGLPPIPNAHVEYSKPTKLSPEEKATLKERVTVMRTWVRMGVVKAEQCISKRDAVSHTDILGADMNNLFNLSPARVAAAGYYLKRTECSTPYLELVDAQS